MKYRHVFWALILIAVGVLFMLDNFGVIRFSFMTLLSLWPLILILWGISILPMSDKYKMIALIGVIALTAIFFERLTDRPFWRYFQGFDSHRRWDWNEEEDETTYNYQPQNLSVPEDTLIGKGLLELQAAAGNFVIQGTTSDFLSFNKTGDIGNYSLTTHDEQGRKKVVLSMEKTVIRHTVQENKVDIRLSERPSWNLDLDIGAAEITMDLRDYRIDTATFNAGASSIEIQIGTRNPLTVMTFNAGASSIKVDLPKESGCQIKSESFMVSKEFEGFTKTANGIYETANYGSATNKIILVVKTAVSKIEINRF